MTKFCPQCKTEYRTGFTHCSDCGAELVDRLPAEAVDSSETSHPEPVVIRTYGNRVDADLAKTALEAAGIDSWIRSDDGGGTRPSLSLVRGVELLVSSDTVEAAADVLDTVIGNGGEESQ